MNITILVATVVGIIVLVGVISGDPEIGIFDQLRFATIRLWYKVTRPWRRHQTRKQLDRRHAELRRRHPEFRFRGEEE